MKPNPPRLRLVGTNYGDVSVVQSRDLASATREHSAVFVMLSAQAVTKSIVVPAVDDMLLRLAPKQRLEFVHEFRAEVVAPEGSMPDSAPRYRFSVRAVCAHAHELEPLAELVRAGLRASCPAMHFERSGLIDGWLSAAPAPAPAPAPTSAWHLELTPLLAATRPGIPRFEAFDVGVPEVHLLPALTEMPGWAFTAWAEPLDWPTCVEVSIRLVPYNMGHAERVALAKLRHRLLANSLVLFMHGSAMEHYAALQGAVVPCTQALQAWLTSPEQGLAVDCTVQSSGPIQVTAMQRLVTDIFGNRAVTVNAVELAALHVPPAPRLHWTFRAGQAHPALFPALSQLAAFGVPVHFAAPAKRPPATGGVVLGHTVCGQGSSAVALLDDSRDKHLALWGATGAGKSSLLLGMLADDMASALRPGVALLDPHGTLVHDVLSLIPKDRVKDVILVDVTDAERCASINPLHGTKADRAYASFVGNEIVTMVDTLFEGRDTAGPVLRQNLRTTLALAGFAPKRDGTFLDALRCWEDPDYGDYLSGKCGDRTLVSAWEKVRRSTGENGFQNWIPYMMPRLSPFCSSPAMRRLFNRPVSTLNIAQAMAEGRILLFNLSKGVLGETESRIAGNLVLNMFFAAALARGRQPGVAHKRMNIFIDEAQSYCTDSTVNFFAEARKFGLAICTANQSIGQLRNHHGQSTIADGVLACTASKIFFRLGPSDIDLLQPYFKPQFDATDMATLPDRHGVVCMPVYGQPLPPFVVRFNRPTHEPLRHASISEVVAQSRAVHTRPIGDVNRELIETFDLDPESLGQNLSEVGSAIAIA